MPEQVKPPQVAALLLSLFASEPDFPQIVGDMSEEFHQRRLMGGLRSARRWYWRESFRNVLVFTKRPGILQALAVAVLCVVIIRIAYPPFVIWGPCNDSPEIRQARFRQRDSAICSQSPVAGGQVRVQKKSFSTAGGSIVNARQAAFLHDFRRCRKEAGL